jgi:PAS domain S-box-containing protein
MAGEAQSLIVARHGARDSPNGMRSPGRTEGESAVDRTAAEWRRYKYRHQLRKILAAIVPPLAVALIQWHFKPTMARWSLFYPAVFLSAWFGGAASGIAATVGSGLIVWWAFMPPWHSWASKDPANILAALIFAFVGIAASMMQQRLRNLADQRRLFAALIENSSDFIGIADPSQKPVYLNPAGRAMVGLRPDAPLDELNIAEFYAPEVRDFALHEIEPATMKRGLWAGETWFRHWRAGTAIPIWQHNFLVRDPKTGRLLGIGTITRDISEMRRNRDALQAANQRLTEQAKALAESQRLLEAVMDFSPNVIIVKDLTGRYVLLNRMFASMLGMSVDAARGKTDYDLFPAADAERHRTIDASVIEKRAPASYEEVFERNGVRRVFLINKFPLHDAADGVFGVCAIWSEITERKRAEEALRRSEADLREAERIAHVGSWTWDARDDRARWSEELYHIFGRDTSHELPALFREESHLFTAESVKRLRDAVNKTMRDGRPYEMELSLTRPDESVRHVMAHGEPIRDEAGRIVGIAGTAQDITELREAQRMRDEWTSVIAHDLRQPIGVILMAASALPSLHTEHLRDKESLFVSRISSAANALARMVEDLLDLSLLEARRLELQCKWINARQIVSEAIARLGHITGQRHVRVVAKDAVGEVFADPMRVGQVVGNLISNAVKYGEEGTEIEVRIEQHEGEVEIAVTNHGRGINAEDLPNLFARFMRSKEARGSGTPGLGVGLYIARELVEAHKGRIWAESTPGRTTTFHMTLPSRVAPRQVA